MKVYIRLPKEVVDAIEDVVENTDLYESIDEFVENAVCKEINELFEMGLSPVYFIPPLKRRAFIKAINNTQKELEDVIIRVRDSKLKQKLEELYSALGKIAREFCNVFSGSPNGEEKGDDSRVGRDS
jgi:hypothetical protein